MTSTWQYLVGQCKPDLTSCRIMPPKYPKVIWFWPLWIMLYHVGVQNGAIRWEKSWKAIGPSWFQPAAPTVERHTDLPGWRLKDSQTSLGLAACGCCKTPSEYVFALANLASFTNLNIPRIAMAKLPSCVQHGVSLLLSATPCVAQSASTQVPLNLTFYVVLGLRPPHHNSI